MVGTLLKILNVKVVKGSRARIDDGDTHLSLLPRQCLVRGKAALMKRSTTCRPELVFCNIFHIN